MMEVVNVRVAHLRPRYVDLKAWMDDPRNVYIARGRIVVIDGERYPPKPSPYANPYKVGGETSLLAYEALIRGRLERGELSLDPLRGKRLGCWCAPNRCHGDVLVRLIEEGL